MNQPNEGMRESKKDKKIFPQQGTVVVVLKNGIVLHGKGMVDVTINTDGDYQVTGTFIKENIIL